MKNRKEERPDQTRGFSDAKLLQVLITGFVLLTYVFIFLKMLFLK